MSMTLNPKSQLNSVKTYTVQLRHLWINSWKNEEKSKFFITNGKKRDFVEESSAELFDNSSISEWDT